MATPLIALCAVIYLGVAFDLATKGNLSMALVFLCYAGANGGLMLAAR